MDALGPYGLAAVIDFCDGLRRGGGGIHLFVTDRAQALRSALLARCPEGWKSAPLFAEDGDRLDSEAYAPRGEVGRVHIGELDHHEPNAQRRLRALNTDREWLLREGICAAVIVSGRSSTDADAGHLAVQEHAPDFWSVRSQTHRMVGADTVRDARDRLLDALVPRFNNDRNAALGWLDTRDFEEDWVAFRLWREGPQRDRWMAMADAAPRYSLGVSFEGAERSIVVDDQLSRIAPPVAGPLGAALVDARWEAPRWPSGRLDSRERALVKALGARLDDRGCAELYAFAEGGFVGLEGLERTVLTVGLVDEASSDLALHFDATGGLEASIVQALREAGDHFKTTGLGQAARRLAGALGDLRALLLVTNVTRVELDLLRLYLPGHRIVALVRPHLVATFGVCASRQRSRELEWAHEQLSGWPRGATKQIVEVGTAALDLRAAQARARYVIALWDSSLWGARQWDLAPLADKGERTCVFELDRGHPSGSALVDWRGPLGDEDGLAAERLLDAAREYAGAPSGKLKSQPLVDAARERAAARPDVFLADLAEALDNLSEELLHLGRRDEASEVTQEVADIHALLASERTE